MNGTGSGAVGVIDHRTVAEYKSSAGNDAYHLVVYDSTTGGILAMVYDKNTETGENYILNNSGRDKRNGDALRQRLPPSEGRDLPDPHQGVGGQIRQPYAGDPDPFGFGRLHAQNRHSG